MSILDELAAHARERVLADAERNSPEVVRELALQGGAARGDAFRAALRKPGMSFICEVKRASPSKGLIAKSFPYLDIAREYARAGADAVSVLTEPKWFLGSDAIFRDIRAEIDTPMLRKDFTVDAYQIYQAKVMGADAVLLICALLDTDTLRRYLSLCADLGLAALVEAHDEYEIDSAVSAGAEIIGVNNRNLKDFSVDFGNAARLRDRIPPGCLYVAESGVRRPEDVAALREVGADAVLIGEAFMRSADKGKFLAEMRAAAGVPVGEAATVSADGVPVQTTDSVSTAGIGVQATATVSAAEVPVGEAAQ
ncbi:MAG: indole-3-glycerol phosphate synthase TrpC [Oscillibacter sp.]|nr:indole-3-glycerol phosphate synthase TrpC [Oscillibacter sp.]